MATGLGHTLEVPIYRKALGKFVYFLFRPISLTIDVSLPRNSSIFIEYLCYAQHRGKLSNFGRAAEFVT